MAREPWLASVSTRMRRKRAAHFLALLRRVPPPVKILDVGGTEAFWQQAEALDLRSASITLLNCDAAPVTHPSFTAVVGDACQMSDFRHGEFDVVFSNSVIEHVGDLRDQARMAQEVLRVGRRYYVQTPNRYFPIEPHFFLPYFQFYPYTVRAWLLHHVEFKSGPIGWHRAPSHEAALALARSIRLLNERELRALFPDAHIWREKVGGLTKSMVAYGHWE